jgi:hypothetical protein
MGANHQQRNADPSGRPWRQRPLQWSASWLRPSSRPVRTPFGAAGRAAVQALLSFTARSFFS